MVEFIKLRLLQAIKDRTPLGLLQLKHDKLRLLTAIAGITFADILIFMQLGFADALVKTNTQYPRALQTDLVIVSREAKNFGKLRTFSQRRLYQALDVPGVATSDALHIGSTDWRNPETRKKTSMLIIGQNPARPAFNLPDVNEKLALVRMSDAVLFDQGSRGDYTEMIAQVQAGETVKTEIGRRTVEIAGLFRVGASFADDGALITSDQNFLRLFGRRDAGTASLGLVNVVPGADVEQVRTDLEQHLPDDVFVFTHQGYVDFELDEINSASPIGFVFGLGSAMGFIVGVVIVYQVLSTDVNTHPGRIMPTFRAMGYRNSYLLGIVFEEALILSGTGLYTWVGDCVRCIPADDGSDGPTDCDDDGGRAMQVLVMTFVMCCGSGARSPPGAASVGRVPQISFRGKAMQKTTFHCYPQSQSRLLARASCASRCWFDIEMEIAAGEIVIMTGPSGSGKTTLLTLIGGLRFGADR